MLVKTVEYRSPVAVCGFCLLIVVAACKPQADGKDKLQACSTESDCLAAQLCRAKYCRDLCNSNGDCEGTNQVCDDGACMPKRAKDAGEKDRLSEDTAGQDTAMPDAAAQDRAGLDAAVADANRGDTSLRDLPSSDLGYQDVARLDLLRSDVHSHPDLQQPDQTPVLTSQERYIHAICERTIRCQPQWGRRYLSLESCIEHHTPCADSTREYQEHQGDLCRSLIEGASCDDIDDPHGYCSGVYLQSSNEPVAGAGQSCLEARCASGLFCQYQPLQSLCPVCREFAAVGEHCTGQMPAQHCQSGTYCNASSRCEQRRADGQSCETAIQCASSFCRDGNCSPRLGRDRPCGDEDLCESSLLCLGGICTDRRAEGENCGKYECTFDATCRRGQCAQVHACTLPQIGEPCTIDCEDGAFCDWDLNECFPLRTAGEVCYTSIDCSSDTYCDFVWGDSGLCRDRIPIGGDCSGNAGCVEGAFHSFNGSTCTCLALLANGELCPQNYGCESDFCNIMGICADPSTCMVP